LLQPLAVRTQGVKRSFAIGYRHRSSLSSWRQVALRPGLAGGGGEFGEPARRNGGTGTGDQLLIIGQVDLAEHHCPKNFLSAHQVVEVGTAEAAAIAVRRLRVERPRIVLVPSILQVDDPEP